MRQEVLAKARALPVPLPLILPLILTLTLARCAQGLALARLIFNRDRGEDAAI